MTFEKILRNRTFVRVFVILLLFAVLIPFSIQPIFAAFQSVALAQEDRVVLNCPTNLNSAPRDTETLIACASDISSPSPIVTMVPTEIVPDPEHDSFAAPGQIEAENYTKWFDTTPGNSGSAYRQDDVDIQACSTCTNGFNIGWFDTHDWMEYPIVVVAEGNYTIQVRVASIKDKKSFRILLNETDITGPLRVPNTGGWQKWEIVTSPIINLQSGLNTLRLESITGSLNVDSFEIISANTNPIPSVTVVPPYPIPTVPSTLPTNLPIPSLTPVLTPSSMPTPPPPINVVIPGHIEAEHYAKWFDTTPGNIGGAYRQDDVDIENCANCTNKFAVGWIEPGEWLEYPVIINANGTYQIQAQVATTGRNKQFRFLLNGTDITGALTISNTGGWQKWATVISPAFTITTGSAILRLESITGNFNIDSFDVVIANTTPTPALPTANPTQSPTPVPTNQPFPTNTAVPSPPIGGTTYYVDVQKGNDANTGLSSDAAWRTLAKVNAMTFKAGDHILLRRGQTWREELIVPSSGAPGNPIVFSAYGNGERPIIDCAPPNGSTKAACKNGVFINGKSHIRIDQLILVNADKYGIHIKANGGGGYEILNSIIAKSRSYGMRIFNANDSVIDNNDVYENRVSGIAIILDNAAYTSQRVQISNNRVYRNVGSGIDPLGLDAQHSEQHGYHTIIGNTIYENGDGIYLHYTVRNHIANNTVYSNNNVTSKAGEGNGIALSSGVHYNQVYDNKVFDQRGVGIHIWGGVPTTQYPRRGHATYNDLYRNQVYNNSLYGIFLSSNYVKNSTIAYNLIYKNGDRTKWDQRCVGKPLTEQRCGFGLFINSYHTDGGSGHTLANNTVVQNAGMGLFVNGDAPLTIRNNIFSGNYTIQQARRAPRIMVGDVATLTANCYNEGVLYKGAHYYKDDIRKADNAAIIGDPQFASNNPYHLQAGSPCRTPGQAQQGDPYVKDLDGKKVSNPPLRGSYKD